MNYVPIQNAHAVNHSTHQRKAKKIMTRLNKMIVFCFCILVLFTAKVNANPIRDIPIDKAAHFGAGYIISDQLQRNAKCSAFEAFLITTGIAWAKEKLDDQVDNDDAYATMAGALFYQIEF